VAELLDHVQKGDEKRFREFCQALEGSGQPDIAQLLRCNDAPDASDAPSPDPSDVPLSMQSCCKLTKNWNYLIDAMTSDDYLVGHLQSHGVFADLQLKKLRASN